MSKIVGYETLDKTLDKLLDKLEILEIQIKNTNQKSTLEKLELEWKRIDAKLSTIENLIHLSKNLENHD